MGAQQIMGEALHDAGQSALAAHHRSLETAGGGLRVVSGPVDQPHLEHAGVDADTVHPGRRQPDRHGLAGSV